MRSLSSFFAILACTLAAISTLFGPLSLPGATDVNQSAVAMSPGNEDALYHRVLRAYRGLLPQAEIEALEEEDPGPALFLGPNTPGERAITRFFASLPDTAHAELQRNGHLKWRIGNLPALQRRWLEERVRQLELRGDGPFPVQGKSATFTGFAKIDVEGVTGPQYYWWIYSEQAKQPAWLTVVRVLRTGTEEYSNAHRLQLPKLVELPESAAIPAEKWIKLKEPPKPVPVPEKKPDPLIDEAYYWNVVKAYRRDLKEGTLQALIRADRLMERRLQSREPADRGLNDFFARLSDEEHQTLLTTGRLLWRPHELSKRQVKQLEPMVARLNAQARQGGVAGDLYNLAPYGPITLGLAVVVVPEVEKPVVSWWIRSPLLPTPAWVTLLNGQGLEAPLYYRAHLEQLRTP